MTKLRVALFSLILIAATRSLSPEQVVKRAHLIVRATALGYFRPPTLPRLGRHPFSKGAVAEERGTIRFHVEEVIKGKYAAETIDLEGRVAHDDDFNEGAVPYTESRKLPDDFIAGREYVLILRETVDGYSTSWAPRSPTSEQIHGSNDAWTRWIRARIPTESH
jgi:hypothetical protein